MGWLKGDGFRVSSGLKYKRGLKYKGGLRVFGLDGRGLGSNAWGSFDGLKHVGLRCVTWKQRA